MWHWNHLYATCSWCILGPLDSGSHDTVALCGLKCQGKRMSCYIDLNEDFLMIENLQLCIVLDKEL